jgi:aldehyde dehydrogenase family 7 protein A1
LEQETLVGPLHSSAGVASFTRAISEVQSQGGKVLVGGKVREMEGEFKSGYWVEPTIVLVEPGMEVVKRETFAPILYVQMFETLEEAIEMNNSVEQGLSSSLFTT